MSKLPEWLRWALIIPEMLAASVLSYFLLALIISPQSESVLYANLRFAFQQTLMLIVLWLSIPRGKRFFSTFYVVVMEFLDFSKIILYTLYKLFGMIPPTPFYVPFKFVVAGIAILITQIIMWKLHSDGEI